MALATVTIDASALQHAAGVLSHAAAQIQRDLDVLVSGRLRAAEGDLRAHTTRSVPQPGAPEHTPHMAELWQTTMFGQASGAVGNAADYSLFQFTGTRRHHVGPAGAAALRFFDGGSIVFSRGHEVSGISPNAPLGEALRRQVDLAAAELGSLGVRVATHIAAQVQGP